jgi:hypothetical protein
VSPLFIYGSEELGKQQALRKMARVGLSSRSLDGELMQVMSRLY